MKKKRYLAWVAAASLSCLALAALVPVSAPTDAFAQNPKNLEFRKPSGDRIRITVGSKAFTVDLYDNPTAKDLMSKLPLRLNANNYAGYDEKVIRLSRPLSMDGAPQGDEPLIPEVGYYEPGNWIALYYGPIGYWSGKVPLGKIDATVAELGAINDDATVVIEAVR